ncbi:hypothetical protein GCM10011376_02180 [Nocardioides flavus (ex Wang et al. 2016)]|uniref:Uncharacterized protein n=1 Tax=Nocardioides flavus (ex Wang et al. 2016) TaxID=2058780 RepID=A0ABQ3HDF2_9ACTN|nr:hypothetical protein [Nocardioides flavus (ex Wang et al. 2016)]GHE15184.1 hypothetical protein GCM10011376_02180 [Nocardioides flavus (ex Wang et al. 2016)]
MSKMDNLRAMREARYAEAQKRAASTPTRPKAPVAPAASKRVAERAADATAADGLCGHRNMSGRTCTRESGHPQKSHRYS